MHSNFDVISLTTLSGAFHLCFDFVMARTKTARKSNVDNRLHVKRHRCRFPGCDRMFAFRQGMSRHMILGGMPTFNTLAPGMATDANPLSAPHVEGMDETASYAAPDEPECDEALPAPPPRLREPRSLARVRRCTSAPVGKHAE